MYKHFDNSDKEMTNKLIIDKVKDVWNKLNEIDINLTKKHLRLIWSIGNKEVWMVVDICSHSDVVYLHHHRS